MRILFGFLLVFFLYPIGYVYATDYCTKDIGGGGSGCGPKKFFDTVVQECIDCQSGYYCPGDDIAHCCYSNTNNGFPLSESQSESKNACYKTVTCKKMDGGDNQCCRHYYDDTYKCPEQCPQPPQSPLDLRDAHYESDTGKCYTNTRRCGLFNTSGCLGGTVGGAAKWQNGQWNLKYTVSGTYFGCTCENSDFTNSNNCSGKRTTRVHTSTVPSANNTETINYQDGEVQSYYCTSCTSGYYVEQIYHDSSAPSGCKSPDDSQSYVVCGCTKNTQGWYGVGCSWDPKTLTNQTTLSCVSPCPVGQTTDGTGATSLTDCQFTVETQFCDAGGCFTLDEIQNTYSINPSEWTPAN